MVRKLEIDLPEPLYERIQKRADQSHCSPVGESEQRRQRED